MDQNTADVIKHSAPFLRLVNKKKGTKYEDVIGGKSLAPEILFVIAVLLSIRYWHGLYARGSVTTLILWLIILVLLFVLAIDNAKSKLLRNTLIMPLAFAVIVYQLVHASEVHDLGLLGSAILGGIMLGGIPYIIFQLSSGRWIGGGDVKLGFVAGLLLGWKLGLLCLGLMLVLTLISFATEHLAGKDAKALKTLVIPSGAGWALSIITCILISR